MTIAPFEAKALGGAFACPKRREEGHYARPCSCSGWQDPQTGHFGAVGNPIKDGLPLKVGVSS